MNIEELKIEIGNFSGGKVSVEYDNGSDSVNVVKFETYEADSSVVEDMEKLAEFIEKINEAISVLSD